MSGTTDKANQMNCSYLCFSGQDWWYHNRAHSEFQLMTRVARNRKVLLINSIGMRMPLPGRSTMALRRVWRKVCSTFKLLRRPIKDLSRFYVYSPIIIPFYSISWVRNINYVMVACQVRIIMWLVGINKPIVIYTLPTAWEVVRRLPRTAVIYNRSDKHSEFGETDQSYIRHLEQDAIRHSDLVLYVSRALMADEADAVGKRGVFVDHGVDLEHFQPNKLGNEPIDLAPIPHPRIGFFGGFDDYVVDFGLLERVAQACGDAQLVLIGLATCSMDRLTKYPNVHWLGFKPYSEIPEYGIGFDVALMPWLQNDWIRNCNPIKMKEYLALGLDIVSTEFHEIEAYRSVIRVARDSEHFIALIGDALNKVGNGDVALRRASVCDCSWDHRAEELVAMCESLIRAD